jgi:hypothetical protein
MGAKCKAARDGSQWLRGACAHREEKSPGIRFRFLAI